MSRLLTRRSRRRFRASASRRRVFIDLDRAARPREDAAAAGDAAVVEGDAGGLLAIGGHTDRNGRGVGKERAAVGSITRQGPCTAMPAEGPSRTSTRIWRGVACRRGGRPIRRPAGSSQPLATRGNRMITSQAGSECQRGRPWPAKSLQRPCGAACGGHALRKVSPYSPSRCRISLRLGWPKFFTPRSSDSLRAADSPILWIFNRCRACKHNGQLQFADRR